MELMNVQIPPLGDSIREATLIEWKKKKGDIVKVDEIIAVIDTEKVSMDLVAPVSGIVNDVFFGNDARVPVGAVIASIEPRDDLVSTMSKADGAMNAQVTTTGKDAVPSAIKAAVINDIAIDSVNGSGKRGVVMKSDVMKMVDERSEAGAAAIMAKTEGLDPKPIQYRNDINARDKRAKESVPMTRLRKNIAKRLKDSQNTAAILTTFNEVDLSEIKRIRATYGDLFAKKHGVKLGFMSFFVKAVTIALQEFRELNAFIVGDDIIYHNYCDIGVAVSTDNGLFVPILRDAQELSLAKIEAKIVELSDKARNSKITPEEMSGGTFSITNGGVFGSLLSTPIINPPQSGILGMHSIVERPVAVDGQVVIRPMMYIALSYDHRLIDGKTAVKFLVKIKDLLENQEKILLDI